MLLRGAAIAAVLAVVLSGCSTPWKATDGFVGWEPMACDPAKPEERSVVQGQTPDPKGDLSDVARRLGEAVGDPVVAQNPLVDAEGRREWKTGQGSIRTRHALDPETVLEYTANRRWPGLDPEAGKAALDALARGIGYPGTYNVTYRNESGGQLGGRIDQTFQGRVVGQTATLVTYVERSDMGAPYVRVLVRPFWDLPDSEPRISTEEAFVIAHKFLRCELDKLGRNAEKGYQHRYTGLLFEWLPVHNRTVAYVIESQYHNPVRSSCPSAETFATIWVDVWTGAVLAWEWNRCGNAADL